MDTDINTSLRNRLVRRRIPNNVERAGQTYLTSFNIRGLSTGEHCIFGHLGLVFIWGCFVFFLLFLLFYVISAPVPAEVTNIHDNKRNVERLLKQSLSAFKLIQHRFNFDSTRFNMATRTSYHSGDWLQTIYRCCNIFLISDLQIAA